MNEVRLQHPSSTTGKSYGVFTERQCRRSCEYRDDGLPSLWRISKTQRDSFLPSIATKAEPSKEKLQPSPRETYRKPMAASLKMHCQCPVSFTSLPSRVSSSLEKEANPYFSFKVILHTSFFFFF